MDWCVRIAAFLLGASFCGQCSCSGPDSTDGMKIRCINYYFKNLTCSVASSEVNYILRWLHRSSSFTWEENEIRTCDETTATSCTFNLATLPFSRMVHLVMKLQTSNEEDDDEGWGYSVDLFSIGIISEPMGIHILETTKHNISMEWLPPPEVSAQNAGTLYQIAYCAQFDCPYDSKVTETVNKTWITLSDLIPGTLYTIKVRARLEAANPPSVFWSSNTTVLKRTLQDVPYHSPSVLPGATVSHNYGYKRNVTIYFQDLHRQYWNGNQMKYHAECCETYKLVNGARRRRRSVCQSTEVSSSSATFTGLFRNSPYLCKVHAVNEEGFANVSSSLYVDTNDHNYESKFHEETVEYPTIVKVSEHGLDTEDSTRQNLHSQNETLDIPLKLAESVRNKTDGNSQEGKGSRKKDFTCIHIIGSVATFGFVVTLLVLSYTFNRMCLRRKVVLQNTGGRSRKKQQTV